MPRGFDLCPLYWTNPVEGDFFCSLLTNVDFGSSVEGAFVTNVDFNVHVDGSFVTNNDFNVHVEGIFLTNTGF